jgi:hypothetical protein
MRRPSTRFLLVIAAGLVLGFAAGTVTAVRRGWGSPVVSVVVENRTTELLSLVHLQHAGCGGTSSLSVRDLAPGGTHTFRFLVCGEGGYKLDALFENRTVLSSGAYVENGYEVREVIEPRRIASTTRALPL